MAYSPIEQKYLDTLAMAAFPEAVDEPMVEEPSLDGVQLAAGPSATRTDAPAGVGLPKRKQPTQDEVLQMIRSMPLETQSQAILSRIAEDQKRGVTGQVIPQDPTLRQKLSSGFQDLLKAQLGMDNYRARRLSETVFGGDSSGAPLGIGLIDVTPFVIPLAAQEAGLSAGEAMESAESGKYGQAALQYGTGVLQSLDAAPGVALAAKGAKKVGAALAPAAAKKAVQTFEKKLSDEFESLVEQYSKLKDTQNGRILNTDDARELSDEYRKNRSLSSAIQDPASAFIDRLYEQKLLDPTPQGFESRVLILGGGGGSGKSSGRKKMGEISDKSEIVYDTTLSNLETAQSKIDRALKAGREVVITYTARDPIEAFYGVLERAMRQEKELGSGRTVPLEVFARQHPSARANIEKLADVYADNPNVKIIGIDNTFGIGNAKVVPVAGIPKFDYNDIEEKLYEILKQERQAGRISESVYSGTLQDYRPKQRGSQDRSGTVRQPESDGSGTQQNTSPSQQVTGGRRAPASGAK